MPALDHENSRKPGPAIYLVGVFLAMGLAAAIGAAAGFSLAWALALAMLTVAAVPVVILRFYRIDLVAGLALRPFPPVVLLEGVVLLALLTPGVHLLGDALGVDDQARFASLLEADLWVVLVCLILLPAVCEEILFRGFFLQGLRPHWGAPLSLLLASVIFAAAHGDVRLLPTMILGLLFGCLVLKSGSIWPAILLHGVNNVYAVCVLQGWAPEPVTPVWLAALGFFVAAAWITVYCWTLPQFKRRP